MLVIVRGTDWLFFRVSVCAALEFPTAVLPKERLVGVALTCACRPRGDATTAAAKTKAGRKWRPGIRDELLQRSNPPARESKVFLVGCCYLPTALISEVDLSICCASAGHALATP